MSVVPDVQRDAAEHLLGDTIVVPEGTATIQQIGGSSYARIPSSRASALNLEKGDDAMVFYLPEIEAILVLPKAEVENTVP